MFYNGLKFVWPTMQTFQMKLKMKQKNAPFKSDGSFEWSRDILLEIKLSITTNQRIVN